MDDKIKTAAAREQIPYLHFLRTAAILFVIMLHSYTPYFTDAANYDTRTWFAMLFLNAFSRAGVPLFFMMSGYLMMSDKKALDVGAFYKKRLPRIVIPLVIYSVIFYAYDCISGAQVFGVTDFLSKLFSAHNGGMRYHLWYLYTLIGFYFVTPFLKRIVDNCTRKELWAFQIVAMFFTAIMPVIHLTTPIYVYFFDPLFNGYMGYFIFGYVLGTADTDKKYAPLAGIAMIAAGFSFSFFGNHVYSSAEAINPVFNGGYYLNHYLIAGGIFILAKRFYKKGHPIVNKMFALLSEASFVMYFVHTTVIDFMWDHIAHLSPALGISALFLSASVISAVAGILVTRIKLLKGFLY